MRNSPVRFCPFAALHEGIATTINEVMSEALQQLQTRLDQLVVAHRKTPEKSAQHFSERVEIRVLSERIAALQLSERSTDSVDLR
jgi:hypothetical protein